MNILFITANIASHVLPAINVARKISGHQIGFASSEDSQRLVQAAGFRFYSLAAEVFCRGKDPYLLQELNADREITLWQAVKFYFTDQLYKARKQDLLRVVGEARPDVVILDVFCGTDFMVLAPVAAKILFLSPMLSTRRSTGFPMCTEDDFPAGPARPRAASALPGTGLLNPTHVLQLLTGVNPGIQLTRKFYGKGLFRKCRMVEGAGNLTLFAGVPELVLAPVELEFDPAVKKPDQHYLGLCVDANRKDEEIDPAFYASYDEILERSKKGKVIYCAFGTYCTSPDEVCAITEFAYKLGTLMAGKADVTLILALPPGVQNVLTQLCHLPGNAFVFSRVPQQKVLAVADLFITHGGLSSVREAVFWGVPMLVYPLDLDWDQKGNGLKVEFHRIGLRGELRGARPEEIMAKVQELLVNPAYRDNVRKLGGALQEKYSDDYVNVLINDLIRGAAG